MDLDNLNYEILKNLFNIKNISNQIKMDILDVYNKSRPSARILTTEGAETECIVKILVHLKLFIKIGKGKKIQNKVSGKLNVIDYFSDDLKSEKEIYNILYIGIDEIAAEISREKDESQDDLSFGNALGYPQCCIRSIINRKVPTYKESMYYLSNHNKYSYLTWPVSAIANAPLIPHIPCSMHCIESMQIAKNRIKTIKFLNINWLNNIYEKGLNSIYSIDENSNNIELHTSIKELKLNFVPIEKFEI